MFYINFIFGVTFIEQKLKEIPISWLILSEISLRFEKYPFWFTDKVKTYDDQEMFKAIKGGGQGFAIPVAFTFNVQNAPGSYSSITNDYKIIDDGNVVARSTLRVSLNSQLS